MGEIFTMAADGAGWTQLTSLGLTTAFPSWSADGSRLAVASYISSNYEIQVLDANGANARNVSNHPSEDIFPSWSPDGTKIAFQTNRDGRTEIYVMNADGSGLRNLTNRPSLRGSLLCRRDACSSGSGARAQVLP